MIWGGGHQLISIYSSTPSLSLSNTTAYTPKNAISVLSSIGFPSVYARRCTRYGVVDISSYQSILQPLHLVYLIQMHIHHKTLYQSWHLEDSQGVLEKVYTIWGGGHQHISTYSSTPSHSVSNTNAFTPQNLISVLSSRGFPSMYARRCTRYWVVDISSYPPILQPLHRVYLIQMHIHPKTLYQYCNLEDSPA